MMSGNTRLNWRAYLPLGSRGWLWRTPGFTAAEVRQLLRGEPPGERAQAVRRCLARPGDWLPDPDIAHCPPRYHRQLTRLIFWYAQGVPLAVISLRLSGEETSWGVSRALEAACQSIADCLNHAPRDYGLDLGQRLFTGGRPR